MGKSVAEDHDSPTGEDAKSYSWYLRLKNQTFAGTLIAYSLKTAVSIWSVCTVLLLGGGVGLLLASRTQVTIKARYDHVGPMAGLDSEQREQLIQAGGVQQRVSIPITEDMESPIRVYYELRDYYQNHKRYVRSVSYAQINGDDVSPSDIKTCIPQRVLGSRSSAELLISPCGLIAWSYFNDTFSGFGVQRGEAITSAPLVLDDSKLVWATDRDSLFGDVMSENYNTVPSLQGGKTLERPFNEDEHFMAWMRVAIKPDVRKFWGTIETDLRKGDTLTVDVTNQYNTYGFSGQKWLVIANKSSAQSMNSTFGVAWLIMGGVGLAVTLMYIIKGRSRLRVSRNYDRKRQFLMDQLSWMGQPRRI